jgi:glycosyltransferase involved in cell wall biosynthesis
MIDLKHKEPVQEALFSILIPTWNNLSYLQLCIKSITRNSAFKHQIIVHINEGNDGTLGWVKENGLSYTHSKKNIGVCWALNAMRSLVETDYMVFLNDDMYVCPGWDAALLDEIRAMPDNRFCLSSTLIQPRKFWCKSVISSVDFGVDTDTFREDDLLEHFMDVAHYDWSGSTWPPTLVHRDIWDLAGGYSVELSPGMYSDPDFSAKLFLSGIRIFKGVNRSRVYHFEARSTKRVRKNNGTRQFLFKWGLVSSAFMKNILHRGEPYEAIKKNNMALVLARMKSRLKIIAGSFVPLGIREKIWKY